MSVALAVALLVVLVALAVLLYSLLWIAGESDERTERIRLEALRTEERTEREGD